MSLLLATVVIILCHNCNGQLTVGKDAVKIKDQKSFEAMLELTTNPIDFDMEGVVQEIENHAHDAEILMKSGITASEELENINKEMIIVLDKIEDALKRPANVDKFVEARGFFRVFSLNLHNTDTELRTKLLIILKDVLGKVSEDTRAGVPINIVDGIMNIFEVENNLGIKAHAVDVLGALLPNNPVAQLRVMKIKGLEVFYKQINKLDVTVIETLMELLNKILKEHLEVRRGSEIKQYDDDEKLMYQRMGLMELLATPDVCNGMLHIFTMLWSHNSHEYGNIKTLHELLKNMHPFCSKFLKRKPKAITFFESLLKNVKEQEGRGKYFDQNDVNVGEFINVVGDYSLKEDVKDEF